MEAKRKMVLLYSLLSPWHRLLVLEWWWRVRACLPAGRTNCRVRTAARQVNTSEVEPLCGCDHPPGREGEEDEERNEERKGGIEGIRGGDIKKIEEQNCKDKKEQKDRREKRN